MDILEGINGNLILSTNLIDQCLALLHESKQKEIEHDYQIEMLSSENNQLISLFRIEQEKAKCLSKEKQSLQIEKDQLKIQDQQWQSKFSLMEKNLKVNS